MESSRHAAWIVIPVHNRREITLACLAALQRSGDLDRYATVVVDDGSTDGTREAIEASFPGVVLLKGDGQLWWTGAIEMGMRYACERGAKQVIWLNDDCLVPPGCLDDLVHFAESRPGVIIGCQGVDEAEPPHIVFGGKRKTWKGYRWIEADAGQVVPCDMLSGNLVCLSREVIDRLGFPDPRATPHYGGDSLYLARAKNRGAEIYLSTKHRVVDRAAGPSALCPTDWLLAEGEPLRIMRLVWVPQSALSWRLWLALNWEAYSLWGLVMFGKKYSSLSLITLLRFLPLSSRRQLATNRVIRFLQSA